MAVPPHLSKAERRASALAVRASYINNLSGDARANLEQSLAAILAARIAPASVVGLYYPMKAEISPLPILPHCPLVGFPFFAARDAAMMYREGPVDGIGPWGVLQPSADSSAVAPDLVIVPLVLADRRGNRIGHGKGHYDRALAHLRAAGPVRTIGIGWDVQVSDEPIDPDPWDVPLDALVTPSEWIDCHG